MPYVSLKDILALTAQKECAIVGCNVHNMEFSQAVVWAAEEARAPIIMMVGEPVANFAGLEMIADICFHLAHRATVPVSILLDHGKSEAVITKCIQLGFSVMFDGSHLPFEENIRMTSHYAQLAHAAGVSIEGELGALAGVEFDDEEAQQVFTDPEQALTFVQRTGIDALAISIGNMHGMYKTPPKLDINRLSQIASVVDIPLVLHGGSNIPESQLKLAIAHGIRKLNFGTDLRYAFFNTLRDEIAKDTSEFKPFPILGAARSSVKEVVKAKLCVSGTADLAPKLLG
jgi:fructose-bisphosphate aldolase, class II